MYKGSSVQVVRLERFVQLVKSHLLSANSNLGKGFKNVERRHCSRYDSFESYNWGNRISLAPIRICGKSLKM